MLLLTLRPGSATETNPLPAFNEVFDLVRTHLRQATPAELDRVAVSGFLAALGPRVSLLTNGIRPATDEPRVTRARVFEDNVAYVRVGAVESGLAQAVMEAHGALCRTGKVVGLVLDLRFAGGEGYPAAAEVAALFLKAETALLDWGEGAAKVQPAAPGIAGPVAVLVNRQTTGAAEALAAVLREAGAGLILGTPTAGMAALKQAYPLRNGHVLQIATTPVKLAKGAPLSPQGLQPDIAVLVSDDEERVAFADPYQDAPQFAELASAAPSGSLATVTNRPTRRPRPTEADLVRARRQGLPLDEDIVTGREPGPSRPVLRDAALVRAVDLLKGLAVVRPSS